MRHPTLRQVEDDLARLERLAPKVAEAARWAWPMAYDRARHAGAEVAGSEISRPVEAAVATEGAPEWVIRSEVARAGVLIGEATQLLVAAGACLARAHAAADAAPVPVAATLDGPPLISKAEFVRARKAADKRRAARPRGVGHGEY